MNFQKKSRSFLIIIFKSKKANFKTPDLSPIIERVLPAVEGIQITTILNAFGVSSD